MNLIIEVLRSALPATVPIMLAALGGLFTWHANVFNISMEGMLLASAFFSVLGSYMFESWIAGLLFGIIGGVLISLLFSFFVLKMKSGEFITGIAINTFVLGASTYALREIFNVKGILINPRIKGFPVLDIPVLNKIPLIGDILNGHALILYLSFIIIVPLCYILLYKTPFGIRLRASGFDSKVVNSLGIKANKLSFISIIICGVLCGIGGSFLSLGYMTMFTENMSNGRGWISLAIIIVTKGQPLKVMLIGILFGILDGLSLTLQLYDIPSQITSMIPYVFVIIVLFYDAKVNNRAKSNNSIM